MSTQQGTLRQWLAAHVADVFLVLALLLVLALSIAPPRARHPGQQLDAPIVSGHRVEAMQPDAPGTPGDPPAVPGGVGSDPG